MSAVEKIVTSKLYEKVNNEDEGTFDNNKTLRNQKYALSTLTPVGMAASCISGHKCQLAC